jgi:hypothetical protein
MTQKFGMTSWDEVDVSTPKKAKTSSSDKFLKLQQGSNVVRILTSPFQYSVHRYKPDEKNPNLGKRIMSCAPNEPDPLMEKGINPSNRCYLGVIDRKTGAYKVLDASPGLVKSIITYLRDEDWGDPKQYDIDIKVDKNAGPSGYYSVVAKPKKPLSPADLEIKQQQVDLDYLKKLSTPITREEMLKRIAAADAEAGKTPAAVSAPAAEATEEAAAATDDYDFPTAD